MKNFSFIILFLSFSIYSQDIDEIKKSDTLYIYFKKDLFKQMVVPQNKSYADYFFIFGEYYKHNHIIFYHSALTPEQKTENKSFLREKKDIIINHNYLTNCLVMKTQKNFFSKRRKYT